MDELLAALGYFGDSLDKPGRALRGVLGGRPQEALAAVPFSDSLGLTDPADRVSGSGLLAGAGLSTGSDTADGVLGFGVELAADPLNLIGGLGLARVGRAAEAVRGANAAADAAHAARTERVLASGGMPADVAAATAVRDAAGNPLRTYHGTPHTYDAYDMGRMNPDGLYGPGIYTTADPDIASTYARKGAEEAWRLTDPEAAIAAARLADDPTGRLKPSVFGSLGISIPDNDLTRGMALGHVREEVEAASLLGRPLSPLAEALLPYVERPRPQVRSQMLDVRRPFDVDAEYPLADVERTLRAAGIDPDVSIAPTPLAKLQAGGTMPGNTLYDLLTYASPGAYGADKALANAGLRAAGFDGITHVGGRVTGGAPHQVYIAFDPAQVYRPWTPGPTPTPAAVPAAGLLLAALAGHNSTARTLGGQPWTS